MIGRQVEIVETVRAESTPGTAAGPSMRMPEARGESS